ncbi:NAD-dependent epimerase/dehydratase family protein [Flavobacteriaceae bacterium]|jgi:dihydroflavonol-4-reductase|nr:NAD-dependent epimerase/dehydratase family protein [Flavobacteriaceae bacterium]|tara:strand:+ start:5255 stop:6247 length:993 start_codon:yes stop_codon:yes gene_type:complete
MILVTGGTGLVGCHLLYLLVNKNKKIKALHRKNSKIDVVKKVFSYHSDSFEELFQKIQWVEGDINDTESLSEAFKDVTEVYHCAAFISFDSKDLSSLKKINVEGTANIINCSLDHKIEKLCYVSSIAAIGEKTNKVINEDCEWRENSNPYSQTKYNAEMEVWRGIYEGLNAVIVNPGVIVGSGFWKRGSGAFITQISRGMKYYPPGSTGFICVEDVVNIMHELMSNNIFSKRFILVAENWSYKDFITKVSSNLELKPPTKKAGKNLMMLALIFDILNSWFNKRRKKLSLASINSSQSKNKYSNAKIKSELNYSFKSVEKAIEETCVNFKN